MSNETTEDDSYFLQVKLLHSLTFCWIRTKVWLHFQALFSFLFMKSGVHDECWVTIGFYLHKELREITAWLMRAAIASDATFVQVKNRITTQLFRDKRNTLTAKHSEASSDKNFIKIFISLHVLHSISNVSFGHVYDGINTNKRSSVVPSLINSIRWVSRTSHPRIFT